MKVLSDIYTYSKDKSSVVFSSNSLTESNKQKKKVEESSWFSKKWFSNSSMNSSKSWFNKISLTKYQIPKISSFNLSFPKYSFPKCSFPKFILPTVCFKNFIVKLEETRINCYLYLVELFKIVKEKSCICLNSSFINCNCIQFNSNPEYINFPWYKRVFFTARDNISNYICLNKECVVSYIHRNKKNETEEKNIKEEKKEKEIEESEEETFNFDKKGSKGKVDEERNSKGNNNDEKYQMKYSQSSKYSNDLTTLRSSKKLKKTNTDDLKNDDETIISNNNNNINNNNNNNNNNDYIYSSSIIKPNRVFSMFSKSDAGNKSSNTNNSPINKSGSLHIDENNNKIEDNNENKNINEIINEESIPGSNETTTESTKFNIKKTWDKFSKIIS